MGECPSCLSDGKRLIRFHPQHASDCVPQNQGFCCFECIEIYMIKEEKLPARPTLKDKKRITDSYRCGCSCQGWEEKIRISRDIIHQLKSTLPNNIKGINDLPSYSPQTVFENSHNEDIVKIKSMDKWDKSQCVNSNQVEEDMNVERGDSDNNNNNVDARRTATNNNPAPGDQDGGSEGAADNDGGGGGGGGGGDDDEDGDENGGGGGGDDEDGDENGGGAAAAAAELVHEHGEDGENSSANNINADGGTGRYAFLSVQFSTSSDIFHHSVTRYLSREELAQGEPITFEIGGIEVTARARHPPPRDREMDRNVRRRTARGLGEQNGNSANPPPHRNVRRRTDDAADINGGGGAAAAARISAANENHVQGEGGDSASGGAVANGDGEHRAVNARQGRRGRGRGPVLPRAADPAWVALQVPPNQFQTCPFCDSKLPESQRKVLPCFDRCIGNDNVRRGIYKHHVSRIVREGDRDYHCWPFGIVTSRGFCDTIKDSLGHRISMNDGETTGMIRFLVVGISFMDKDKSPIQNIFSSLQDGTYRRSSDKDLMMEYISGWHRVLENENVTVNYVRSVLSGRFRGFLEGTTRQGVFAIINDNLRPSVLSLRDQIGQLDDQVASSQDLETTVTNWLSSFISSADCISERMQLSLAKCIFHRLDSIRKSSEVWRNRDDKQTS